MNKTETIYLGGGCFWCTEAIFKSVYGVTSAKPGYMGGDIPHPDYDMVSSGETGHVEVVEVIYDPELLMIEDLLEIFFEIHDSTTKNQQGADIGTQYRSAIFCTTQEQLGVAKDIASNVQRHLDEGKFVTTEIDLAKTFYKAEEYHENYYEKNKNVPYCSIVISPKLEKLQKDFADKLKQ